MDKRKVMLQEALILTVITLFSGLLLGFVHELTKDPIQKQEQLAIQNACQEVFSNQQDVTFIEQQSEPTLYLKEDLEKQGVSIGKVWEAMDADGVPAGYVIETASSEGYGGNITLYVGVTMDGVLNDVSILNISETPGLGMRASEVLVPQLRNKAVDLIEYTKTGADEEDEIDAISGATITTKAVTNAVNGALRMAKELRGGDEE
ncbi:MAG: RnfABCDGE type electron transport complex subunit G [Acetatifactor sp.]|nr:RnfABCDGE type electron transport complex subunit G [Acetatifactor sp.]